MKVAELGSGLGLSGPLKGPLKCLMSAQYDPGLTLVVEMQELDILLLMTGHIAAGLNDTMQCVLRTEECTKYRTTECRKEQSITGWSGRERLCGKHH